MCKYYKKGFIITFDTETRDLSEKLNKKGIDPEDLHFIDCISYYIGKGTPPVVNLTCISKPNDFDNLFYYSLIFLKKIKNPSYIIIIAPHTLLDYSNCNDIGMFLKAYIDRMEEEGLSIILIDKEHEDKTLKNILLRLVDDREESIESVIA